MFMFRLPSPNPTITSIRVIWATNPATLSSPATPMAVVRSSPLRWKKRMLTATRAAVDGTARLTNVMANSSSVNLASGIGSGAALDTANALATRGTWPRTKANRSPPRLAALIASTIDERPTLWIAPMSE